MFRKTLLVGLLAAGAFAQDGAKPKADQDKIAQEATAAFSDGRWEDAATHYGKLAESDPRNANAWFRLGYALHALGRLDEALKAHQKAAEFPSVRPTALYNVACVHALRGDKDQALSALEKAASAGFANADHLAEDSDMDSLRADPRFAKIVAGMSAAKSAGAGQQPFAIVTARRSARLFYWGGNTSAGQVSIHYGAPQWKDSYAEAIDSPKMLNRRWRLGADTWTVLDTNVPLTIGGTKVAPGDYYLALEHRGEGDVVLTLLDPDGVRKERLDAYQAHKTTGGIEVPMRMAKGDEGAEQLAIDLGVAESATKGTLQLRFGPFTASAPIQVHLGD